MLRDGYVTYADAAIRLQNWRPRSPLFYEALFSISMTCLVYQVTKLALEVCLGQRRRGEMRLSDFCIYNVVSSFSFSSIFSTSLNGRRFGAVEDRTKRSAIDTPGSFSSRIIPVAKYTFLLFAIPGIQILGIFLSVETESEVSFKNAKFGGMGMGMHDERFKMRLKGTGECLKAESSLAIGENVMSDFFRCHMQFPPIPFDNEEHLTDKGTFIVILRASPVDIGVTIVVPMQRWISTLHLDMYDRKKSYQLKNMLTLTQRREIFERGIEKMSETCLSPVLDRDIDISWVIPPVPQHAILSASVECGTYDPEFIAHVGSRMLENVTFVEAERLELRESSATSFVFRSGDDIVFFRRLQSYALLAPTVISVFACFCARLLVRLRLYVDAPLAMEMILKERFGLKCCDSMLQVEQTVYYRSRRKISDSKDSITQITEEPSFV
ncbi:unnamed protein product [Agarophyton chilense]|eukprot:gb/GEZJ01001740.1/.p1 GENE.gb/GEZJ01001740.1/~~gb/GEZJ01001740.1/.p1  ORF type:complete len:439 (+),score=45.48 gb/GEZJ01001740.1/:1396-2712(+)